MPELNLPDFENVSIAPPRLDPGAYTLNIREEPIMNSEDPTKPFLVLKLVVQDGPMQEDGSSPIDKEVTDRLYLTPKSYWRVKTFLVAAGRLAENDKDSPMARGKFGLDVFVGSTVRAIVEITKNPENGREYRNYQYLVP